MSPSRTTPGTLPGSSAAPCSEEVENWLDARGVKYKGCVQVSVADIDAKRSRQNQAREHALNADTLERYVQAMRNGDDFPPIVVYKRNAVFIIIDGNHRHEAARKAGRLTLMAYVISDDTGSEMIELLTAEANTKHGDATPMAWRTHQAIYLMSLGHPVETVAAALGLSSSQVKTAQRVRRIEGRAAKLKLNNFDALPSTVKVVLGSLVDDYVFKAATNTVIQTEWGASASLKEFITQLRNLGSVKEQMELLSSRATTRMQAMKSKEATGRRKPIQNPKTKVLTALGMVLSINPMEVPRLFLTEEERVELRKRLDAALERLADIEASVTDTKTNGGEQRGVA